MTSHLHFEVSLSHRSKFEDRVALNWRTSEARYHVWVKLDTLEPTGDYVGRRGICYKNSLVGIREPGYFETRKLSLDSKPNAEAFKRAQQIARNNKLVEVLLAHEAAEHERKVEAERDAARLHRIKEAGPDLLAALQQLLAAVDHGRGWQDTDPARDAARAAIALADGDPL